MSYIAHSIKLCREKTEDDSSFLNFLIPVAAEVANPNVIDVLGEIFTPTPYRFFIEPNNTIH